MTNLINLDELTPQEVFALHQGLQPARRAEPINKLIRHPQPGLPVPHPPEQPAASDEQATYEQFYRGFWRTKTWDVDLSSGPAVGARIVSNWNDARLRAPARSLIVDNLSGYSFLLYIGSERIFIGPSVYNFIRPLPDIPGEIFLVVNGTGTILPCILTFTEQPLPPNPGTPTSSGGVAAAVNVSQIGGAAVSLGQTVMASSLPVVIASNQTNVPVAVMGNVSLAHGRGGAQGNLWAAAVVGANGLSAAVDMVGTIALSVFGNVSAATTILLKFSADNVNFYNVAQTVISAGGAGVGDFGFIDIDMGARYVQLQSTAAATITATAMGNS